MAEQEKHTAQQPVAGDTGAGPLHAPHPPETPLAAGRAAAWLARKNGERIGADLPQRFDLSGAPGMRAVHMLGGYRLEELRLRPLALTISPYAPPQRQLSAVRQGAPMWPPDARSAAQPGLTAGPARQPARPQRLDGDKVPDDLAALLRLHRSLGHN